LQTIRYRRFSQVKKNGACSAYPPRLNLKIVEVPVRYRERVYGETNISRWKHGLLLLKMSGVAARKLRYV
jgi:hypothetical protein